MGLNINVVTKPQVPINSIHHVLILAFVNHCPGVAGVGKKEAIADKECDKSSTATRHLKGINTLLCIITGSHLPFPPGGECCLVHHPESRFKTSGYELLKICFPGITGQLLDIVKPNERDLSLPCCLLCLLPRLQNTWKEVLQVLVDYQVELIDQLCGHPVPSMPIKQSKD